MMLGSAAAACMKISKDNDVCEARDIFKKGTTSEHKNLLNFQKNIE